ncbi:ubiquinol-cytochrome C chaperone family protein [Dongia sp.]|uniref:ubiquinol-cytochrome C chaperone family protein n=1 Tax=Dongia sp. TaxID=1977262 RepID=UPI0035B1439C
MAGKVANVAQTALGSLLARVLRGPRATRDVAGKLFQQLVTQARARVFYEKLGVPDSVDGRFDMVALHIFLIFQRLRGKGDRAAILSQALYDTLIHDFEASLRQLGAGDVGVGKRIRVMTEALQGRIKAYETALAGNDPIELQGALRRNLYGTTEPDIEAVRIVANYLRRAKELADRQPMDRILRGVFEFPPPPAGAQQDYGLD